MTATIPEAPETIEAQLEWLKCGKRHAVLITPGCVMPALEDWMAVTSCDAGVIIFDRRCHFISDFHESEESLGKLLGYGISRRPEQPTEVITIRNRNGTEKQAVTTDESNRPAVESAAKAMAGNGDTVHREDGQKVIADRLKCLDARELKVRPYHPETDALGLKLAAQGDAHVPLNPTHVIEREGLIVGYFGINSLPLYRLWFHSERIKASDSTRLLFMIENHYRMAGVEIVGTIINTQSPFYPHAVRGGYLECGGDRLFLKVIR